MKGKTDMDKIVIITPEFAMGGAETMVARLATNVSRYETTVLCLGSKKNVSLEKMIEDAGVKVHYLGKKKSGSISTLILTWKKLSEIKPKVVHSHISGAVYAFPWILFHKSKMVHTIHTKPDMEFSEKFRKILKFLVKIKKLTLVAVSKENQKIAMDYYGFGEKEIKYVNNPVDTSLYYHDEKSEKNGFIFINVGRQDPNKNQILIIRAMKKITDIFPMSKLILVGNGNQHSALVSEAKRLGLQNVVEFPGEILNVQDYLAKADVYVSSSHREGLPLSMLEAMAAGLPIISTEVGGIPDIIDNNGILIKDDSQGQLEEAMITLETDKEKRERFSKRSLEIVKAYDVKKCAMNYEDIYQSLM